MLPGNQEKDRVTSPLEILAEVDYLLEHVVGRKTNQGLILQYLGKLYERGESAAKEHAIAVEALGRGADFDPKREAIVRVEMHKLRRALKTFYSGPGRERAVQISLASGKYALAVENVAVETATVVEPVLEMAVVATAPVAVAVGEPRERKRRWLGWVAAAMVVGAIGLYFGLRHEGAPKAELTEAVPVVAASPAGEVRILAGAPGRRYVDSMGREWQGDRFFAGGHGVTNNSVRILNTADQTLFRGQREGDFTYEIPLPAGDYEVRTHYAETHYGKDNLGGGGESSRRFQVYVNGKAMLNPFDVLLDAGGPNLALMKIFPGVRPEADGKLKLRFESLGNDKAIVNAIEIVPGLKDRMLPTRISVGATQGTLDAKGRLWMPDRFVVGGRTVERVKPVVSDFPELFRFERFGRFEYVLPAVPGHQYQLRLWMAEQYFGVLTGLVNPRPRTFDIYCNGTALARDFSIIEAAGGPGRGVERTFPRLTPDGQGNIRLVFTPNLNYAALNGIELVDEGRVR